MPVAFLRQVSALFLLLVRHWLRSGMAGARVERFRKGSAFLVRLVAVAAYAGIGRIIGETSLRNAASGIGSVEWLVGALLAFGVWWGMLTRALALRGMTMPLASPLIDTLPVHDGARTAVELLEVGLAHVVTVAAFVNAAPALPAGVSVALGLGASLAAVALGAAAMRWVFVFAAPESVVSLVQVASIAQGLFIGLTFLGQAEFWKVEIPFLLPLARPLAGGGGVGAAFVFLAGLLLVAALALHGAERVGYDRVEVVPRKRYVRARDDELSVGRIDELLARREPGGRRWPLVAFAVLMLSSLAALLVESNGKLPGEVARIGPQFFVGWMAWMALPNAATIANRAVTRDLVARPFLAALPLEPRQLLDGKIAVVRRRIFLGLFPLALVLLAPLPADVLVEVLWRSLVVTAAAWVYGSAAVSVAFLTGGAQNARPQPGGTFRLETLLLLSPLAALLLAESPWTTLVPLASLILVAFEAKRAATRVVRWLDDGEDFERETPAWRAALAFAAFQGSQVLAARLISAWTRDVGIVMGSSYLVSGIVLVGLSAYGRRDLGPLRFWPRNPRALGVAVVSGIGTATFGRFVARRFLSPLVHGSDLHLTNVGQVTFVLTAGALAPVIEEIFFRGWLQHVIARDLDARRKWLAPVITALAFASVHPPASFPAVFALGLVSGVLYATTSSLAPCIAAHAAHNWVATLVR